MVGPEQPLAYLDMFARTAIRGILNACQSVKFRQLLFLKQQLQPQQP
jgi:hypothetical protein